MSELEQQTPGIQRAYRAALRHLDELGLEHGALVVACEGAHGSTVYRANITSFRRLMGGADPAILPPLDRALALAARLAGGIALFCQDRDDYFWTVALGWSEEPDPSTAA